MIYSYSGIVATLGMDSRVIKTKRLIQLITTVSNLSMKSCRTNKTKLWLFAEDMKWLAKMFSI